MATLPGYVALKNPVRRFLDKLYSRYKEKRRLEADPMRRTLAGTILAAIPLRAFSRSPFNPSCFPMK
ncbi:hypothetical protein [Pontibacter liquoris]|uniref:hypothetical protein n=1 Tax=Pontibacter liquoris TaxID=2905677 RepID=UPI001FA700B8|nr:hypothetical protein [Pontibacter liquoris]